MKKNLNSKIALIVAVLAICVYGIFGVPSGLTGKDLGEAITKRIHLGLDLRGGAHLILQVEVLDAVNAETDNTVALLKENLKTANLNFSQVYKPDPAKPTLIKIEGTAPASVLCAGIVNACAFPVVDSSASETMTGRTELSLGVRMPSACDNSGWPPRQVI